MLEQKYFCAFMLSLTEASTHYRPNLNVLLTNQTEARILSTRDFHKGSE